VIYRELLFLTVLEAEVKGESTGIWLWKRGGWCPHMAQGGKKNQNFLQQSPL
jgi:hypothetical protein